MNRAEAEDRGVWEPDNEPDTIEEKVLTPFDLELPEFVSFDGTQWNVAIHQDNENAILRSNNGRMCVIGLKTFRLALDNGTIIDDDQCDMEDCFAK